MSMQLDALEAQVLNLALVDRSHLLDRLVASIEADHDLQQAWELEALERDMEIQNGQVKVVSGKDVLARLAAKLQ
jgi:hypothetical protein